MLRNAQMSLQDHRQTCLNDKKCIQKHKIAGQDQDWIALWLRFHENFHGEAVVFGASIFNQTLIMTRKKLVKLVKDKSTTAKRQFSFDGNRSSALPVAHRLCIFGLGDVVHGHDRDVFLVFAAGVKNVSFHALPRKKMDHGNIRRQTDVYTNTGGYI